MKFKNFLIFTTIFALATTSAFSMKRKSDEIPGEKRRSVFSMKRKSDGIPGEKWRKTSEQKNINNLTLISNIEIPLWSQKFDLPVEVIHETSTTLYNIINDCTNDLSTKALVLPFSSATLSEITNLMKFVHDKKQKNYSDQQIIEKIFEQYNES